MVNELSHIGVLGMKWGVRRTHKSSQPRNSLKSKKLPFGATKINWTPEMKKEYQLEYGKIPPEHITLGEKFATGLVVAGFGALLYKNLKG